MLLAGLQHMTEPNEARPASLKLIPDRERSERGAAIGVRLNETGNWPAEVMTLNEAVDRLRTDTGLPLWIDRTGLADAGISLDAEIRPLALTDVPWRVIIASMLEPQGLAAVVQQDHLLITHAEAASDLSECWIYDIAGLHLNEERIAELTQLIKAEWQPEAFANPTYAVLDNRLLLVAQPVDVQTQLAKLLELLRSQPDAPAAEPSFVLRFYRAPSADQVEDLQLALRHLIAAEWPDDSIQRIGSTLAIRQTAEVHRRIEALMTALQQVTPTVPGLQPNAKPEPVVQPARSGISSGGGGFFQRPVETGE